MGLAAGVVGRQVGWAGPAHAAGMPVGPGLTIHPRADWGADLPPTGPLESEAAGDVRFLLVHHTASSNDYGPDGAADQLRGFYGYHTSAEKGWPDLAYNFLVDRYGGVWEGRAGSLESPIMASATGGSQGFAQLACYIGDFSATAPPAPARASMLRLLAWLADTYGIDTAPGATTSFVSRGSNRWPTGTTVSTPTISAHRDMSRTECPGDPVYADLQANYAREVTALRSEPTAPASSGASPPPPTPSSVPTGAATSVAATATVSTTAPTTAALTTSAGGGPTAQGAPAAGGAGGVWVWVLGAVGAAAAAASAAAFRVRRGL